MSIQPPQGPVPAPNTVQYLVEPLYRARRWIKFLAILSILGGGFYILTLVGIVVAWIPITVGIFLIQAISAIEHAYRSGAPDAARRGMEKLRSLFVFYGVLAALGIGLVVLALVFGFTGALLDATREMR
jgi:hypothetical protein